MGTIEKGGHLRKTASGIVSFAPFMATASTLALGALLAAASPAGAGTCTDVTNGVVDCTGAADSSSDMTIMRVAPAGGSLTVRDDGTFGLNVSSGNGIAITSDATSTGINVELGSESGGGISAAEHGISVDMDGTAGTVAITTNGSVASSGSGGGDGINLNHAGSGAFTLTTNGDVTSASGNGIEVIASAGGGTIDLNSDVTTDAANVAAILIQNTSHELVTVNLNDGVTVSGGGPTTFSLSSAFNDSHIKVSMGDGTSLGDGLIAGGGVNGDLILELRGTATGTGDDDDANSFSLGSIEGADVVEKTGSGTWTITGAPGANSSFGTDSNNNNAITATIRIEEGRLIWDATSEFDGVSVSVNELGTLEIDSARTWSTDIALSGRLALTGASSSLSLDTLTSSGGEIDVDVDFSNGDETLSTARLNASAFDGDPVTVNVRAIDGFPGVSQDDEDGAISIENFIAAAGAEAGDFRAGRTLGRGFTFQLVNVDGANQWTLVAEEVTGSTVYETFAAVLTQLSQTKTLHERLRNRQAKHNTNVYAKPFTSTAEYEPVGAAVFESKTHGLQFGVHAPLIKLFRESWAENVNFDASVEYAQDETEARVEVGSIEIKTESIAAAFGATWERNNTFIDGQFRFANFESDFEYGGGTPADPNATSFSTSIEIGYAFEEGAVSFDQVFGADFVEDVFPGRGDMSLGFDAVSLIPSLQVSWSGVDYNSYTSTEGTTVNLEDGDTFSGRAGLTALGDWDNIAMQGRLGVVMPFEGEVITKVDDVNMSSERQKAVLDIGLGLTYSWGDYAIALDASTQQGEEVEGYAGSVGLKYNF
ncbi:MAG: autotransporter outer membrane beta-barrel domain-containing protein [Hyphomicrobiales bacterium]|nr:autotransporter outer membrane beta-barrel domain-containing protein [Hyphomicrobiales bacterium]